MLRDEDYNKKQDYFFVEYTLFEKGHPEYIEMVKKDKKKQIEIFGSTFNQKQIDNYDGIPRWVRSPFNTQIEVQEQINYMFNSYPNRVENFRIHSEKELNEIITVDEKTGETLWEHNDKEKFKKGIKVTRREQRFGGMYQRGAEYTQGLRNPETDKLYSEEKQSTKTKQ